MENAQSSEWPLTNFNDFPEGMISGMTLREINEYIDNLNKKIVDVDDTSECISQHFASPTSDDQLQTMRNNEISEGTKQRNNWSLSLYSAWYSQRTILPEERFQLPLKEGLRSASDECIDYWTKFIFELRKSDGSWYPRDSLLSIVGFFMQMGDLSTFLKTIAFSFYGTH